MPLSQHHSSWHHWKLDCINWWDRCQEWTITIIIQEFITFVEDFWQIKATTSQVEHVVSISQDCNDQVQKKNVEDYDINNNEKLSEKSHARIFHDIECLWIKVTKWCVNDGQNWFQKSLKLFEWVNEVHVSDNSKHDREYEVQDEEVKEIIGHLTNDLYKGPNWFVELKHGNNPVNQANDVSCEEILELEVHVGGKVG